MYNNNNENGRYQFNHLNNINSDTDDNQFSLIEQQNIFSSSRYTAAETVNSLNPNNLYGQNPSQQQNFHQYRVYAISMLESWGLKMGHINYSKDNQITLKCILQLIQQKKNNSQIKIKLKQQIGCVQFEKQKYQSLLKQSKNQIVERQKTLGKVQNECFQIKKKLKQIQSITKKQRCQDQKMINLLKSKNEQILHEVKKKQLQIQKIKEQMKRNITVKTNMLNSVKQKQTSVKNSFQIIEKIQSPLKQKPQKTKRMINQPQYNNFQERLSFLIEKHEKQKKNFINENTLLRSKIFQIRQILVGFSEYIDFELFGIVDEKKTLQDRKFIINHNLLFSQHCLVNDLNEVIQEAKNGINQLQQNWMQSGNVNRNGNFSPDKKSSKINSYQKIIVTLPSLSSDQCIKIKKKSSSSIPQNKANIIPGSQKSIKIINNNNNININNNNSTNNNNSSKPSVIPIKQIVHKANPISQLVKPSFIKNSNYETNSQINLNNNPNINSQKFHLNNLQILESDLLSVIYDNEDFDNSVISHISTSQLEKQAKKYQKWDILFMKDDQ